MDWLAEHGSIASVEDRKDQLRWASTFLAGKPLAAIDGPTLADLAKRKAATMVRSRKVNPATVNRYMSAVSAVLHHAHAAGWIASVPAIPKRAEAKRRVAWATEEQAQALLDALPEAWRVKAAFSLETGLRRHNVTHLRWSEVDMRQGLAWVHADEAKGGRLLRVVLTPDAVEILRGQKGAHKVYVFPGERVTPVERIEAKVWNAAKKAAGLPAAFRWHDLRHTWASWHAQRGTTLQALMELGGWSSYSMVQRYSHLAPGHVDAAAATGGLRRAGLVLLVGGKAA
jgi:integrase